MWGEKKTQKKSFFLFLLSSMFMLLNIYFFYRIKENFFFIFISTLLGSHQKKNCKIKNVFIFYEFWLCCGFGGFLLWCGAYMDLLKGEFQFWYPKWCFVEAWQVKGFEFWSVTGRIRTRNQHKPPKIHKNLLWDRLWMISDF